MNSGLWVSASGQRHAEGVGSLPLQPTFPWGKMQNKRGWKGSEQRDQEFTQLFLNSGSPDAVNYLLGDIRMSTVQAGRSGMQLFDFSWGL